VIGLISFEGFSLEDNAPIYLQINGFIKRGIVAGLIADGDELPSRRMLSALLGVNPNTVQKSYAMLEEEGLLHSRPGAKSCVEVTEQTVSRLRRELLDEGLRTMVAAMKQMGMTREQAREALEALWEVEQ
jgi:GntR family transcriptional regulator